MPIGLLPSLTLQKCVYQNLSATAVYIDGDHSANLLHVTKIAACINGEPIAFLRYMPKIAVSQLTYAATANTELVYNIYRNRGLANVSYRNDEPS